VLIKEEDWLIRAACLVAIMRATLVFYERHISFSQCCDDLAADSVLIYFALEIKFQEDIHLFIYSCIP